MGKHFEIIDKNVDGYQYANFEIFDHWFSTVRTLKKGELVINWVINFRESEPLPIASKIESEINNRQDKDEIDYLLIHPDTAGRLWLEGRLTQEMFSLAIEEDEAVIVTAEFVGKMQRVVISPETVQPFTIVNTKGEVIS